MPAPNFTETMLVFDFRANTWSQKTPSGSGIARFRHSAAVTSDGKMYVYGGSNGSGFIPGLKYYDIPSNRWIDVSTSGTAPDPRSALSMNVMTINGIEHLVVFGGLFNYALGFRGYCDPNVFLFNTRTNIWQRFDVTSSSPVKRTGHQTSVVGTKLYMFGGYSDRFLADTYVWDVSTNGWTRGTAQGNLLPSGVSHGGISCFEIRKGTVNCFVFGGSDGSYAKSLDNLWQLTFQD